jgi:hypothetical protein
MNAEEKITMSLEHIFLHQLAGYLKNTECTKCCNSRSELEIVFLYFSFHEDFKIIIEKKTSYIKITFKLPNQCGLGEKFIQCLQKNKKINAKPIPQKIKFRLDEQKNIFNLEISNDFAERESSVIDIGEFIILIIKNSQKWINYTDKHLKSIQTIIQTAGKNFRFIYY